MSNTGRKHNKQKSISPGIRPGQSVPFHELGEYVFQDLCRDLVDAEEEITTCDLYGTRGQTQDGIDLLARRKDHQGIDVAQCKCAKDFPPADIKAASAAFFKHLIRWKKEKVGRFILIVASDLDTIQRQNQIQKEIKRFAKLGIKYEAWSATTIRNKLRKHRGIVANYLTPVEHWLEVICGEILHQTIFPTAAAGATNAINVAMALQLETIIGELSKETKQNLDRMRDSWREGRNQDVLNWLANLKADSTHWQSLPNDVKARVIRFEAGLILDSSGDTSAAKHLANAAKELDPTPSNEARLRALIARYEVGPAKGIGILEPASDIDSLNLKAAFYLELDEKNECDKTLEQITNDLGANPETHRLKALLQLIKRDIDGARREIGKALQIAPKWVAIRYNQAIINYFSGLSPMMLPSQLMLYPEPIDWSMIRQDQIGLQYLRTAESTFHDLIALEGNSLDKDLLQAWHLACLMNDPERQEEAFTQTESILLESPTSPYAVVWVLTRNLDINLKPSSTAIEELVSVAKATIPHIIALAGMLVREGKHDKAIKLLQDTKKQFLASHAESLWVLWNVQSLVAAGREKKAQQFLNRYQTIDELTQQAQGLILSAHARKSKNTTKWLEFLEEQYKQTHDTILLLQACDIHLRKNNWDYVVQHGEILTRNVGTPEVVRMVVIANFNAGHYRECVSYLDQNRNLFGSEAIPAELRRMRAACLQAQGKLNDAIAEMESLPQEYHTIDHLRQKAQMYMQIGDLKKLALIGRQYISMPDVNPDDALGMAKVLRQEDSTLAKSLWNKATSQKLPDEMVSNALFLGYELGLDKELGAVSNKFYSIANKKDTEGVAYFKSTEELIEFAKKMDAQRGEIESFYKEGRLPVHVLSELENVSLAELYFEYLAEKEKRPDALKQKILLIRHGAKEIDPSLLEKSKEWQLHLDITAVLLAEHLGILNLVEEEFGPLYIPNELIPSLWEMRDKALHHQPSQLTIFQEIVDFVESDILNVDTRKIPASNHSTRLGTPLDAERRGLFEHVRDNGGYILDFRSEVNKYLQYQESIINQSIVTGRDVATALFENGKLGEHEFHGVIHDLGTEGSAHEASITPRLGSSIYCITNTIDVLGGTGLLKCACEHFNIYIQSNHYEQLKSVLVYHKIRQNTFQRLGELIDKLRNSVELGTLRMIPISSDRSSNNPNQEIPHLYGLQSLYKFPPKNNDVIWVDDRFMNGFSNRDGIPLIGVNEILSALLIVGRINQIEYYKLLNRLRASNLRFVSVESGEIIYYLRNASIRNGSLIETPDLEILRKYIAAVLVQGKILQKPPLYKGAPRPDGELGFILQLGRVISTALVQLWAIEDIDTPDRLIYAEWIISQLYTTHLGLSSAMDLPQTSENELLLTSLSHELLIGQTFVLNLSSHLDDISVRKEYLNWIYDRLLRHYFDANPSSFKVLINLMRNLIRRGREDLVSNGLPEKKANIIYQQFCSLMPDPIFKELLIDADFNRVLGFEMHVTLGEFVLRADDFWMVVYKAINGEESEISSRSQNTPIIFKPFKDENDIVGVLVFDPKTGKQSSLQGSELLLLKDSEDSQRKILRNTRHWFDCSDEEFDKVISQIIAAGTPQKRVEKTLEWRDADLNLYYQNLHNKLGQQKSFMFSDLIPPSMEGMVRHYRLQSETDDGYLFKDLWDGIATEFIKSESIEHSIVRLWCAPIPLPKVVIETIKNKDGNEKRILIKHLLRISKSPTALIHLIKLLFTIGIDEPKYERLAKAKLTYLTTESFNQETEAFLAVVRWVNYRFGLILELQDYPDRTKLVAVWSHSHHLYSIFSSLGIKSDWIQNTFSQVFQLPNKVFELDSNYECDVSNPRKINSKVFITYGIAYCGKNIPEESLSEEIRERVKQFVTIEVQGHKIPHPLLSWDTSGLLNSIDSYLGYQLYENIINLTNEDIAELFQSTNLIQFVKYLIQSLKNNINDISTWISLSTIIRTGAQKKEVKDELSKIISNINFIELFTEDLLLGATAIEAASYEAVVIKNNSLIAFLKNQIVETTKLLAEKYPSKDIKAQNTDDQVDIRHAAGMLIEAALNISKAKETPENSAIEFQEICESLLSRWDFIESIIRPIVQLFCEILPPNQAKHMWKLLQILRAI